MRIGVLGGKGGTGKSTLTAALAVRAAKDFDRVAVVDSDPQGSASSWFSRRCPPGCTDCNPDLLKGLHRAKEVLAALSNVGEPDVVLFDGSPVGIDAAEECIEAADVVVVPIRASPMDIEAVGDVLDLAADHGKPALVVLNAVGQHDSRLVEKARELLAAQYQTARVAACVVRQRVAHVDAYVTGQSGAERDAKAAEEIDSLWAEVRELAGVRRGRARR